MKTTVFLVFLPPDSTFLAAFSTDELAREYIANRFDPRTPRQDKPYVTPTEIDSLAGLPMLTFVSEHHVCLSCQEPLPSLLDSTRMKQRVTAEFARNEGVLVSTPHGCYANGWSTKSIGEAYDRAVKVYYAARKRAAKAPKAERLAHAG